jgi:hypothetical protein
MHDCDEGKVSMDHCDLENHAFVFEALLLLLRFFIGVAW